MPAYKGKSEYKPDPCPVCGASPIVEWNEQRLSTETLYIPAGYECSQKCWTTMPLEEWNHRNAEGLKKREEGKTSN